jgi:hypothetical protein
MRNTQRLEDLMASRRSRSQVQDGFSHGDKDAR